jgi:phthiodiolone/phenolphthiodiolone dimycocerosates ketoreductase
VPDHINGQTPRPLWDSRWRARGVRHIVVVNFGPMQPSVRGALGTVLPFNKVIRGLKKL